MTTWLPITDDDPFRTDDELSMLSAKYRNIGTELLDTATSAQGIETESWQTDAADAYRETIQELCDELQKMAASMADASTAITEFEGELAQHRQTARHLVQRAADAQADEQRARTLARQSAAKADQATTEADQSAAADETARHTRNAIIEKEKYASIESEFWCVVDQAKASASKAAAALDVAASEAPQFKGWDHVAARIAQARSWCHDQPWWDGFMKTVPALKVLAAVAAIAVGVVGLFIGAPIVLAAAAIVGVIALGLSVASALDGSGTWSDVGFEAFGLATMGAGSLISRSLKGAMAGTNAMKQTNIFGMKARPLSREKFLKQTHSGTKFDQGLFYTTLVQGGRMLQRGVDLGPRPANKLFAPATNCAVTNMGLDILNGGQDVTSASALLRHSKDIFGKHVDLSKPFLRQARKGAPAELQKLQKQWYMVRRRVYAARANRAADMAAQHYQAGKGTYDYAQAEKRGENQGGMKDASLPLSWISTWKNLLIPAMPVARAR